MLNIVFIDEMGGKICKPQDMFGGPVLRGFLRYAERN